MDRRIPVFKYRLAPLLRLDQWEGSVLAQELKRARGLVDEKKRLHTEVLRKIEEAQKEMRELHRDDAPIPIERRQRLSVYLNEQYAIAQARGADLSRAEQLFEKIMEQRIAKHKKIRALEEHRGRERQEHDAEQHRAGLKDADDLWLFGRR
jgi:hypothetical protein